MDSTAPGLNGGVTIEEKAFNQSLHDVKELFRRDPEEEWLGFSLDVKSAHKRVKHNPHEHGILLFRVAGRVFFYNVCHFGGRVSAYGWSRVGALLIRILHQTLFVKHGGWLFVDDFLFGFPGTAAPALATLTSLMLIAMGCPISWHKVAFGSEIT